MWLRWGWGHDNIMSHTFPSPGPSHAVPGACGAPSEPRHREPQGVGWRRPCLQSPPWAWGSVRRSVHHRALQRVLLTPVCAAGIHGASWLGFLSGTMTLEQIAFLGGSSNLPTTGARPLPSIPPPPGVCCPRAGGGGRQAPPSLSLLLIYCDHLLPLRLRPEDGDKGGAGPAAGTAQASRRRLSVRPPAPGEGSACSPAAGVSAWPGSLGGVKRPHPWPALSSPPTDLGATQASGRSGLGRALGLGVGRPRGAGARGEAAPRVAGKWVDARPQPNRLARCCGAFQNPGASVWGYVRVTCLPCVLAQFSSKGYKSVETRPMCRLAWKAKYILDLDFRV